MAVKGRTGKRVVVLTSEEEAYRRALPYSVTRREFQVLSLAAQGRNNEQIATTLDIVTGTVKIHMRHLFRLLGVEHRWQLYFFATQLGVPEGTRKLSLQELIREIVKHPALKAHPDLNNKIEELKGRIGCGK